MQKAGALCLKTTFREYKNQAEFLDTFIFANPDFKVVSDSTFISVFFDQIVNHKIPIDQKYYSSIGTKEDQKYSIILYEFSNNRKMLLIEGRGFFGSYNLSTFLVNFPYMELIKDIFSIYNGNVYVSYDSQSGKILFNQLKHETLVENKTYNANLTNQIINDLKKFEVLGMQRSYLFIGEPGTGKSTVCYQVAKSVTNNCIKLDSSLLKVFSDDTAELLINYAQAKVIVIDDIDRISSDQIALNKLLYCVESVKTFELKPILLATANNVDSIDPALIRPGRFDKVFKFELPDSNERELFFKETIKNLSNEKIIQLVELTDKLSRSNLKEIEKQFQAKIDFDEIIEDIKVRKSLLFKEKLDDSKVPNAPPK